MSKRIEHVWVAEYKALGGRWTFIGAHPTIRDAQRLCEARKLENDEAVKPVGLRIRRFDRTRAAGQPAKER